MRRLQREIQISNKNKHVGNISKQGSRFYKTYRNNIQPTQMK